ncbi:MAG TPA: GNAT family N-acetyltransferase [Pyrinomonadaceae bacterium]|nr:GNAT family N-acetyltransferase [Pyrinomonadaceae bacterium]
MAVTMMRHESATPFAEVSEPWQPTSIRELTRSEETEVIEFLAARPIHTVFMAGLIQDHGLISPRNRGSFYGARNRSGQLEGVSLIGHVTLVEVHTESALTAFARVARNCQNTSLIRGERQATDTFWRYFAEEDQAPRLVCAEHLLEIKDEVVVESKNDQLRLATMSDLESVISINAAMALEEGGSNPLQTDPTGFRSRTIQRIEKGRVWVWVEDHRLIFKADIVSQTPEATYLEGIYVNPEERGQGHGFQCLTQICSILQQSSPSICLTVNEHNQPAIALYTKAGFRQHSNYETIYLR